MLPDKKANFLGKLSQVVDLKNIFADEALCRHTSFKIGGPASFMVLAEDETELADIILLCREERVEFFLLGNGTNVLVADEGFDGVVIKLSGKFLELGVDEDINEGTALISAGAGVALSKLAYHALKKGFTGLEFAHGIPGSVGGGVFMNAGAYGGELKDVIYSAEGLDKDMKRVVLNSENMEFGYRKSSFMENDIIITKAVFKLKVYPRIPIRTVMESYKQSRMAKQPLELPSAGSTFKRPEGYFAGKLIEEAGLKGFRIGDAQVSEKHAGFIVNLGNATAKDVMTLIEYVRERVKENSGVELEPEIRLVGME